MENKCVILLAMHLPRIDFLLYMVVNASVSFLPTAWLPDLLVPTQPNRKTRNMSRYASLVLIGIKF